MLDFKTRNFLGLKYKFNDFFDCIEYKQKLWETHNYSSYSKIRIYYRLLKLLNKKENIGSIITGRPKKTEGFFWKISGKSHIHTKETTLNFNGWNKYCYPETVFIDLWDIEMNEFWNNI